MKTIKILAAAALLALPAAAQNTTKLTSSKANDFGLAYTLPNTAFDIVIETEMTERQPGEYYNYANRYLNSDKALKTPQYSAKVKSVTIVPKSVPNADNRWMVELKGQGITYMMVDDLGAPLAINTEEIPVVKEIALPVAVEAAPTPLETPAAQQAVTQEMASSTSTSKRAQLAAQRIYELRDIRNELISGQADNMPPDGKSLQLALDNLSAQEAALTAMFLGTEKTWTQVNTVSFTPEDTDVRNLVIARVSPTQGIVAADDLSGAPIYLNMEVTSTGDIPTDANGQPKKEPKGGFAYNIPGTAIISVTSDGKKVAEGSYEIAQLGKMFYLDPKIFTDKKAPSFAIFNPLTGGVTTIGTIQK